MAAKRRLKWDERVGEWVGLYKIVEVRREKKRTWLLMECQCGVVRSVRADEANFERCDSCSPEWKRDVGSTLGKYKILDAEKVNGRTVLKISCSAGHERVARRDAIDFDICFECDVRNPIYKSGAYNSWDSMLQRCYNENNKKYSDYGGRGIRVCDRWKIGEDGKKPYICFYEDMGERPEGLTLHRVDNNRGYVPDNCVWADASTQGFVQRRRSTNTSGKTGVSWDNSRKRWLAGITVNRRTLYIGSYDNFDEAVAARELAELRYFGENVE